MWITITTYSSRVNWWRDWLTASMVFIVVLLLFTHTGSWITWFFLLKGGGDPVKLRARYSHFRSMVYSCRVSILRTGGWVTSHMSVVNPGRSLGTDTVHIRLATLCYPMTTAHVSLITKLYLDAVHLLACSEHNYNSTSPETIWPRLSDFTYVCCESRPIAWDWYCSY